MNHKKVTKIVTKQEKSSNFVAIGLFFVPLHRISLYFYFSFLIAMNKLVSLFGTAIVIFLLAFCVLILAQRNKQTFAKWATPSERYNKEAENVSNKVDKVAKIIPKLYNKVREEANSTDLPETENSRSVSMPAAEPVATQHRAYTPIKTVSPTAAVRNNNYETPTQDMEVYTPPPTTAPKPELMSVKVAPLVKVSPNGMYQVQLGIYRTVPNYESLRHLGAIYIEKAGDQQRVYLGNYATRADADRILASVRTLGFKDAFVKTIDNTTIVQAAPAKTTAKVAMPTTTTPTATVAPKSAAAAPELDPKCNCPKPAAKVAAPANTNETVFVVQLGASQFPVLGNARKLTQYGGVYKDYDAKHDLTKIMLGTFATQTEADQALQAAKKLGFGKAFVKQTKTTVVAGWKKVL